MKKCIRSISAIFLALVMIFSNCVYAYDMESKDTPSEPTAYERVQELFPEIEVTENGYVVNYDATADISCMTPEEIVEMYNEPVETYCAVQDTGTHFLEIYEDGTYSVYGFEETESDNESEISLMSSSSGSSGTSSNLKVYWNKAVTGGEFQMYYNISYTKNASYYAVITPISAFCIVARTGTLPALGYTIASGTVSSSAQTTRSGSAKASSTATVALNSVNNFGMKLTISITCSAAGAFTKSVTTAVTGA